jgi:uncharacterized membrane protein
MNKLKTFSALTTSLLLCATLAKADNMKPMDHTMQEKCKIADKNEKNLIKANMADGVGDDEMNKMNTSNDADAWVWIPKGWCDKVNDWAKGDMKEMPKGMPSAVWMDLKKKLDVSM